MAGPRLHHSIFLPLPFQCSILGVRCSKFKETLILCFKPVYPGAFTDTPFMIPVHWGKPPSEPLTPAEFAAREPLWNQRVAEWQDQ